MKQTELEEKVRELFERQGFDVEKEGNILRARNEQILELNVFSSEKFSIEEINDRVKDDQKIFVDEELGSVKDELDNDISVLKEEQESPDFDIPSYELIGSIAVINDLAGVKNEEAIEGIKYYNPGIETILLKEEGLSGEFRVGDYRKLYGEKTETVHKEHGCRYKVDPTKVYFSERFSTERERVISQIEDGEKVLVMFAGVGPFAIMAAKNANPEKVIAVEKNPEAAKYLKENIQLNNLEDILEGIQGDVKDIVPELGSFDRIIMPLPGSAQNFKDEAFKIGEKEAVVHYYRFVEEDNFEKVKNEINNSSKRSNRDFKLIRKVKCGEKSPAVNRTCFDIKLD